MTAPGEPHASPARRPAAWHMLAHKNVLAGLMFMAIAIFGLWVSRDYPIGTALRMGTGYVPRLLCWALLGLGYVPQTRDVFRSPQSGRAAAFTPSTWSGAARSS